MKLAGFVKDRKRVRFCIRRLRNGEEAFRTGVVHRIEINFCWYDFWVGWFWNSAKGVLWICPLPMLAISIQVRKERQPR